MHWLNRLILIDALRGVAVLGVVAVHYGAFYLQATGQPDSPIAVPLRFGAYGVPLFFVISGYVVFMTLDRSKTAGQFALSRLSRLCPAFWVSMLFSAALIAAASHAWGDGFRYKLVPFEVLANLTMDPALFGLPVVDPAYWSLSVELAFYALAGIVFLRLHVRRVEGACLVWLTFSMALQLAGFGEPHDFLQALTAFRWAHLFITGIMIFRIRSGHVRGLTLLTLAAGIASPWITHGLINTGPIWYEYPAVATVFAAAVWLASSPRGTGAGLGWLIAVGRISYSLYLLHQIPGLVLFLSLMQAGCSPALSIVVTAVAILAGAKLLHDRVEVPAQRRLRALMVLWATRPDREPA
jgi:peptidoglycan/LPS O-acetylase OafA/YrhL